jgi:hypothetical protein
MSYPSRAVVLDTTDDPNSPLVDEFYRGYQESFILPDETEDLTAFKTCLSFNHGSTGEALRSRFGEFSEYVAIVRPTQTADAAMLGGANFIVMPHSKRAGEHDLVTVHLNYSFVAPVHRRKGHLRGLISGVQSVASQFASVRGATSSRVLIIFEQNDPFMLTLDEEEADTQVAGISQLERVHAWARLGAAILDFAYVQPPLSPDKQPERRLALGILGLANGEFLSSCVLHDHLHRFFAISVLKSRDPQTEPSAAQQLLSLASACTRGQPVEALHIASQTEDRLGKICQERRGRTNLREVLRSLKAEKGPEAARE